MNSNEDYASQLEFIEEILLDVHEVILVSLITF
jgi:hypothetical protein